MSKAAREKITNVVISTILGHGGMGMFPYILDPRFWYFMSVVWLTKTSVIAKSATRHKRIGNFIWWNPLTWKFVHRIKSNRSILNSFGLTNPGVWICAIMIRIALSLGFNVIPSFFADFSKGYELGLKETLEALNIFKKILGGYFYILEINPSCPNSGEDILDNQKNILELCRTVKKRFPNIILIVKGSIVYPGIFYNQIEQAGVDIIHTMNTIPFDIAITLGISPYQKSPLGDNTKGGYSGELITSSAYDYAKDVVIPSTSVPLIFGGGISGKNDMLPYIEILQTKKDTRDSSFSICTLPAYRPMAAANLIRSLN
ncbi:MAG: hypothetical protein Q8L11_01955 [Candidatus Moranbacteria bacterium]|nr:hypothetical protein [bacterium]MDP1833673.1 hypothetical protein [Candidatus Moranbacteria bacterium]